MSQICDKQFSQMIDTYMFKSFDIIYKRKKRKGKEKERIKNIRYLKKICLDISTITVFLFLHGVQALMQS